MKVKFEEKVIKDIPTWLGENSEYDIICILKSYLKSGWDDVQFYASRLGYGVQDDPQALDAECYIPDIVETRRSKYLYNSYYVFHKH